MAFESQPRPQFERPDGRESMEARMDRMAMLIEQQQRQIGQLTEMLRQQQQPVSPLRAAYAAVRARDMAGQTYEDPYMRTKISGDLWKRQVVDPMSGQWVDREIRPAVQMSQRFRDARYEEVRRMRQYAWDRNNTELARQRDQMRQTAAFAMGPDVYFNVGGARDRMFAPTVSGTDIAYQQGILRAGGAEYISPSGNYAVLPMRGPRTGVGREDPVQAELKNHYANEMDGGALEAKYDHLRGGTAADKVFAMLDSRRSRWGSHPDWRYGDLAWARSQFEFLEKGRQQDAEIRRTRESIGDAQVLHTEAIPVDGDPYKQIRIDLPEGMDPYGKRGYVLLQPNSHQKFWDSKSIAYAREAGIDFQIDTWPNGRARGIRITFTKPGAYTVAGRQVFVGTEGEAVREQRQKERVEKKPRLERTFTYPAGSQPREFIITQEGEKSVTVDVSRLQPGEAVDAEGGVTVVRNEDGTFKVQHFMPGSYYVNIRFQGDRQLPYGKKVVR